MNNYRPQKDIDGSPIRMNKDLHIKVNQKLSAITLNFWHFDKGNRTQKSEANPIIYNPSPFYISIIFQSTGRIAFFVFFRKFYFLVAGKRWC